MARAEGGSVAPWLVELARNAPGLVRSYLPGSPIDARTRERVMLAVTEGDGSRWSAWVHGRPVPRRGHDQPTSLSGR